MTHLPFVEVTYDLIDGFYVFASEDRKVYVANSDAREAATAFCRLLRKLKRKGVSCWVQVSVPLGPALKMIRNEGAIARTLPPKPPEPPQPMYWQERGPSGTELRPTPPPLFLSWADYLARTSNAERMHWCAEKANGANRRNRVKYGLSIQELSEKIEKLKRCDVDQFQEKLEPMEFLALPPATLELRARHIRLKILERTLKLCDSNPKLTVTKHQVWSILEAAQGRCAYCRSLAVESAPVNPTTGLLAPWAQKGRRIGSLDHIHHRFTSGENHPDNLAWSCLWCNTWPEERRSSAADHGGYYPEE